MSEENLGMDVFEEAGSELRARMSMPVVPASVIEARGRRRRRGRRWRLSGVGVALVLMGGVLVQRGADENEGVSVLAHGPTADGGDPVTRGRIELPVGPPPTTPQGVLDELEPLIDAADLDVTRSLQLENVAVWLRPGREQMAAAILERYGTLVDLRVGGIDWPAETVTPAPPCDGSTRVPASGPAGVDARLEVTDRSRSVGDGFDGTLVVHNGSAAELRFSVDGSGAVVYVVEPGSDVVVGHDAGPRLLSLEGQQLPPGATGAPIRAHAGVTSCRPARGTAVQPGEYELVAVIPRPGGDAIVSNRVAVEIVAPPAGG